MNAYEILKTFNGSNGDGVGVICFQAGTIASMADSLAAVALREGWARELPGVAPEPAKAETKIETPVETKVVEVAETKLLKGRRK